MESFRKTAPEPLAPADFNLAKPFFATLANGLKVVIFENRRLPLVNFRLAIKNGAVNEPRDMPGLAEATAKMLSEGTATRTSRQIAEETEKIGATLNASASADNTVIGGSALAMYADDILALMADILLNPTFPVKELEIYCGNQREELKLHRSQADFLAGERAAKILFGSHPYGVVSTTNEALDALSSEKLAEHHRAAYLPNNAVFVAVGDVNHQEFLAQLDAIFGGWQPGEVKTTEFPALPERKMRTLAIVDRANSAQANIILGDLGMKRSDPDFFPVAVMNMVLGGGASSRLFMNLREEKGYTYGAYSSFDSRRLAGTFEATAEVRTAVAGDALKEFFYELDRIRTTPVPDEELADAKNYLSGSFPLRMETQEGLNNQLVSQQLYGLPEDYLQTYRENISAVTADDVARVAQKYINPDKLAMILVGDTRQLLPQVRSFCDNIEIYDAGGNLKDMNDFVVDESTPPANVAGEWAVSAEAMGQALQITLNLQQDGSAITGRMDSAMGGGELTGTVTGDSFNATSHMEIMGQEVDLSISGTVTGDEMSGSINAGMPGLPDLPFSGEKKK
jgi:zinc protease